MKQFALAFLVVGFALMAVPVHAADAGRTTFDLKGHTDSDSFWTEGNDTAHNPTLTVPASTTIAVTFTSVTGTHTLQVGSNAVSKTLNEGDDATTYTFTSPASGEVTYMCTIHGSGMSGKFVVAGSASTNKSPSLQIVGVSIAIIGAALLLRRQK